MFSEYTGAITWTQRTVSGPVLPDKQRSPFLLTEPTNQGLLADC